MVSLATFPITINYPDVKVSIEAVAMFMKI